MTTPYSLSVMPLPYGDCRLIYEIMTTAQARHTWVASPTVVNQVSYGFAVSGPDPEHHNRGQVPDQGRPERSASGRGRTRPSPTIAFSGPNAPSQWRGSNSPAFNEAANTFTLAGQCAVDPRQALLNFRRADPMAAGQRKAADLRQLRPSWTFSNTQTAAFNATGTLPGHYQQSLRQLSPGRASIPPASSTRWGHSVGGRLRPFAWWVQDNYKVSRRLTLNIGAAPRLLYTVEEVRDRMSWLNPTIPNPALGGFPGILMFAGYGSDQCHCRNNVPMYWPRSARASASLTA